MKPGEATFWWFWLLGKMASASLFLVWFWLLGKMASASKAMLVCAHLAELWIKPVEKLQLKSCQREP